MVIIVSILVACIFILTVTMLAYSSGKSKPFLDETGRPLAGSISEKIYVDINGVKQGMFIKSKNVTNPVLLYLHGGMPDYFLTYKYPTGLEDYFTVVWWEQRDFISEITMDILRKIGSQFKKPIGPLGKLVSNLMIMGNRSAYKTLIKDLTP